MSVNDLHRGLSSSVFRVEQITQNLSCGRISQTVVKSAYALFAVW